MSKPNVRLKPSSEWAREAPEGATALVVAECSNKGQRVPCRRVALGWLTGDRSNAAPLREAAAKLPETAVLASDTVTERKEADGAIALSTSERCHVRWTVRSILLPMLICWSGFEDGFNAPVPKTAQNPEIQAQNDSTAAAMAVHTGQQNATAGKAASPRAEPVPQPTVASDRKLPQFAPLEALILNSKKAFSGNCAVPDAKFLTDGRMLLLRTACSKAFLREVKPGEAGAYGPQNPVAESACQKMFDSTIADARYVAQISGYVLSASVGIKDEPEDPLACVVGPGERITVVNGHRLKLILNITGANVIKTCVDPKSQRIVLSIDEHPVAILMTVESPSVEQVFRQMLGMRTNVAQLRPETGARKAS